MTDDLLLAGGYLAALLGGTAFGSFYFALLWRGTSGFVRAASDRSRGTESLLLGFSVRLALAGGAMGLAIWAGATAAHLLSATLGFTLARQLAIQRNRWQG